MSIHVSATSCIDKCFEGMGINRDYLPFYDTEEELNELLELQKLTSSATTNSQEKVPCRTSLLSGKEWVKELLEGHPTRIYENLRMDRRTFVKLCQVLCERHYLEDNTECQVSIEEAVAIFLYTVGHNQRQRVSAERFQHSTETINRHVKEVMRALCKLAKELIVSRNLDEIPPEMLYNPKHYPYFKVGTYFVGQYYQMLQNQPDFVHQFYSDASTMLRIDGNTRETATAMLQIHQLTMSLNYTGIEIKTAHSLESWNAGVLVMVSGSVNVKDFNGRKKFVETFFLAPQEKGYFVLNDIFHYVDEEQILQHPIAYLPRSTLDSNLHSSATIREQVPNYMLSGDIQSREFVPSPKIEEDGPANNYNYPEEQLQQVPETEQILDNNFAVQSNGSLQGTMNSVPDHFSPPIEEPVMEPQKHTYASIVAKGQPAPGGPSPTSFNRHAPSEWQHVPEIPSQPSVASSNPIEKSGMETFGETTIEDEVEVKSVYVRNVPTTMAASEIGEEFKKFGKLKPDGVAIRTRKDIDVCYAFVEFEDISGVQNAIKKAKLLARSPLLYDPFELGTKILRRHPRFRLVHTNSTLKGEDRTETTPFEEEEEQGGVEAELATKEQEDNSVAGVLAGGAINKEWSVIITDRGVMVSIGKQHLDKKGHTQLINKEDPEMGKAYQKSELKLRGTSDF
ncbi:hypothetical protein BUALT_Bualt12G0147000 [Buddleja alternifolia]|uniref:Uncharacterized protein n=1 Tax=Buddleja alternifolia TaxID=168488 RepID=A0AAV6WY93_9LAMI|nr:hypothetical protein BUALT_Bualt12G0147000 [Buddleja alternifolia]